MIVFKLCFYLIVLAGCTSNNAGGKNDKESNGNLNNMKDTTITVEGLAEDAKSGATVVSEKDQVIYYVDGLDFWPKNAAGKKVRVTGELFVEKPSPVKKDDDIPQQVEGDKNILRKPKWELL